MADYSDNMPLRGTMVPLVSSADPLVCSCGRSLWTFNPGSQCVPTTIFDANGVRIEKTTHHFPDDVTYTMYRHGMPAGIYLEPEQMILMLARCAASGFPP